ncbi:MAG: CHAT domain-containing protein [Bryobacteraceae bacterium]|nr:CHAT domain-containing protein [Bryobacteraceae bacterium]
MRAIAVAAGVALLIPTVGSVIRSTTRNIDALIPTGAGQLSPLRVDELRALNKEARKLAETGQYIQAAKLFEQGYRDSFAAGNTRFAVSFLTSLANCRQFLYQFRPAMEAYLEARKLAAASGDRRMAAILSTNLASLYVQQGAFREAEEALDTAMEGERHSGPQPANLARMLLLRASLMLEKGDAEAAISLCREALNAAELEDDRSTQVTALDWLGEAYLAQDRLAAAEDAMARSFRLHRLLEGRVSAFSYGRLSMLRLAQGNLPSAADFIEKAFVAARESESTPMVWFLLHIRAKVLLAQGRLEEALSDLELAMRNARELRVALLPAESIRVGFGVDVQQLHELYVEAAGRLYFATGREELARKAFEAAEQNRALGLRESLRDSDRIRSRLAPEYWEALKRLTEAENQLFRAEDAALRRSTQRLRRQLTELEIDAGFRTPADETLGFLTMPVTLTDVQRALRPDETLFSFLLGERGSYVFAVTRQRLALRRIEDREPLRRTVHEHREAIQAGEPARIAAAGRRLYEMTFGRVGPEFLRNPDWLLLLDGPLFEAPLAGLAASAEPVEYVVERHSLRVLPAAGILLGPRKEQWSGPLLAVSDPVYNTADPRWGSRRGGWSPTALFRNWIGGSDDGPQFARLAGSAHEAEACARAYDDSSGTALQLAGLRATTRDFQALLGQTPAVIHLATHVVPSPRNPNVGNVAFSLTPAGGPELLGTDAISSLEVRSGLIVMSGCSSGAGELLPAEGLWGLTRAWMRAGAQNVAATLWPTLDTSGDLLQSFYRHLGSASAEGFAVHPAKALQLAQLEMLRSGTWRAEPRHWANYVVYGKH